VGVRQGRMKAPGSPAYAFYHCMSRIVDRRFLLEAPERDQFEKYMDEYAQFCGVTVITHNVMSNHFHLLLLVPKAPETPLTDEELLSRIEALSCSPGSKTTRQQLELFRQREQHEAAEALRQRFLVRMWERKGRVALNSHHVVGDHGKPAELGVFVHELFELITLRLLQ